MQKLRTLWRRIERGAHAVGDFQARIILSVLYVIFVLPVGLFVRTNDDALGVRASQDRSSDASHWQSRQSHADDLRAARRQF